MAKSVANRPALRTQTCRPRAKVSAAAEHLSLRRHRSPSLIIMTPQPPIWTKSGHRLATFQGFAGGIPIGDLWTWSGPCGTLPHAIRVFALCFNSKAKGHRMNHSRIEHIAVVGAGLMGHGIAQEFALAGYQVFLHDVTEAQLENALSGIWTNLGRLAALGRVENAQIEPAVAAITTSTDLGRTVGAADLVIEAIVEDLEIKHALFRSVSSMCREDAIIASNTSSFVPSRLAESVSHPDRLLVAHYFNPPYLIPLVEIVPGPQTSDETVVTMVGLLQELDKQPVVLRKEATGFVGNRLQFALFREALAIVEQGIADPLAVDQVVRFGFGRRLAVAGPFEIFDLAGLDTILAVASQILPELDAEVLTGPPVPELLSRKVAEGNLGVKSGRGFHEWTPKKADELRDRLTKALLQFDSIG